MTMHGSPGGDAHSVAGTKSVQNPSFTMEWLNFVLPLTAEQVMSEAGGVCAGSATGWSRREWRWIDYAQRLNWLYGAAEAIRRLNAGAEPPAPKLIAA